MPSIKLENYEIIRLGGHDRRYSVEKLLGDVDPPTAYLLKDWDHNRDVVVKFLGGASDGMDSAALFVLLQAARSLACLSWHANLLTVQDTGVYLREEPQAGRIRMAPYILAEWAESGPISRDNCATVAKWRRALRDTARGLEFLHACNRAHGNITSSNILICKGGETKLSDAGLRAALMQLGVATEPPSGAAAAPQTAHGAAPTFATDIYQLWKVFSGLASGRGWNIPGTDEILARMTDPTPGKRPTAQDLVKALDSADVCSLGSLDTATHPPRATDAECLEGIRATILANIQSVTTEIANDVAPLRDENGSWYITVLMRPAEMRNALDYFIPVYFAHYRHGERIAHSDWDNTTQLRGSSLPIGRCCAGIPVELSAGHQIIPRLEKPYIQWNARPEKKGGGAKWVILSNLRDGRKREFLKGRYARDSDVGWKLRDKNGQESQMEETDTEIVVPIYGSCSHHLEKDGGAADKILGVVNVEYVEGLSPERREEIAAKLVEKAARFPFSVYTRNVLYYATRQFQEEKR
jgi:hypothetical protein